MTSEYTITIRAPVMPNPSDIALYLKAEVLGINKVQGKLISAPELAELTGFCKSTILSKCKHINEGTSGKAMYNKDKAIAALSAQNKAGRKRQN